jgi:hypothetical protein
MALAHVASLVAKLKTTTEALNDANAAKVSADKAAKQQKPGLRRLKKL